MRSFVSTLFKTLLCVTLLVFSLWGALAIWFRAPWDDPVRIGAAAIFFVLGLAVAASLFVRLPRSLRLVFAAGSLALVGWWSTLTPPAIGDWSEDVAQQTTGKLDGDILTLTDIRDFRWHSDTDFDVRWIEESYDLNTLSSLDLFLSYWSGPAMAHFILSFGFENGDHIAWSVEVRREKNSGFSPVADFFKEHTLSILASKETDVVGVRTNIRQEDVHLYRLRFDQKQARSLLLQYVEDANELARTPRWYNSITTNCTTVVFQMMQAIGQGRSIDWRILANGYLPEYGYEWGAVTNDIPLEELKERTKITAKGLAAGLNDDYSNNIRVGVPLAPSSN